MLPRFPGLVGDVARYVNSKLETPNSSIALATALSFVAALKCGRVECDGINPNLYCCVIAPSGSGKTQAQNAIQGLIAHCDLQHLLMGKPASDSGLLAALSEDSRRYLIWDEFGIALSELANSKSSYRALILSTLMDLYSTAGIKYLGKQYSERSRVDIESPYLSILAGSTPNRFFGSLNEDFVCDGFLARWLVFHCPEEPPSEPSEVFQTRIYETIERFEKWPTQQGGDLSFLKLSKKVYSIDRAQKCSAKEHFKLLVKNSSTELERVFWARGYEQFMKLLLIISDNELTDENYTYAHALTHTIIGNCIKICRDNLGTNQQQRSLGEKVRNLIKPGGEITMSALSKLCYDLGIKRFERDQLIESLLESGEWTKNQVAVLNSFKKLTVFKRA